MNRRIIGQQCCYDSNGDYTKNGKSAGSADYSYPLEDYLNHQATDYFPYRACCVESDDSKFCSDYYELRPWESDIANQCNSNSTRRGMYTADVSITYTT